MRLVAVAVLAWTGWTLLFRWGRDTAAVTWWCEPVECGAGSLDTVAPFAGVVVCLLLLPLLARFLDRATFGTVLVFGGLATWSGLQRSVDLRLTTAAEAEAWSTRMLVLMVVGGVLAVVGGVRSVQQSGLLLRLLGRASAPARISVRTSGAQTSTVLTFRSSDGRVHDVPLTKPPRVGTRRVVALYDPVQPDWAGRVSVGLLRAPRSSADRAAWERRLAEELPLDPGTTSSTSSTSGPSSTAGRRTTTLPSAGSARPTRPPSLTTAPTHVAISRAEQIRQLDALRAAGQITTAQADQAAAQVLADLFRATFPTFRR